jgi:hypothetical protein
MIGGDPPCSRRSRTLFRRSTVTETVRDAVPAAAHFAQTEAALNKMRRKLTSCRPKAIVGRRGCYEVVIRL